MSVFGMCSNAENPRQSIIRKHILSMARSELIFKPSPFIDLMKSGLPDLHVDVFCSKLTLPAIDYLFKKQMPRANRVGEILTLEDTVEVSRQEQLNCFYYSKQFLPTLNSDDLGAFLQFVTGGTIMPEKKFMFSLPLCLACNDVQSCIRAPTPSSCQTPILHSKI